MRSEVAVYYAATFEYSQKSRPVARIWPFMAYGQKLTKPTKMCLGTLQRIAVHKQSMPKHAPEHTRAKAEPA